MDNKFPEIINLLNTNIVQFTYKSRGKIKHVRGTRWCDKYVMLGEPKEKPEEDFDMEFIYWNIGTRKWEKCYWTNLISIDKVIGEEYILGVNMFDSK